jgi:alpha-1,6-mannosyltransferase
MSTTTLVILVGLSTWLMLVFQPDGSIGLYTLPHVLLATFAAVVAARSLVTVDPLRLRSVGGAAASDPAAPEPAPDLATLRD